jgi:glucose-6-phosphate-specific signal transduction histidine kinase
VPGSGFGVEFWVRGLGFRGLGFRVSSLGLGFWVSVSGLDLGLSLGV